MHPSTVFEINGELDAQHAQTQQKVHNISALYNALYHCVRLRLREHTVTISRSAATHAERLPIEHGPRRTLWVIGFREG